MRARALLWLPAVALGQIGSLPAFPPAGVRWISLREFLEGVRRNALTIQQAMAALPPARWELYQAQANFLPSLTANASATQNYGTTFDPFAFQRVQQTTTFSSASLAANWVLFAGFANHYLVRQAQAGLAATRAAQRRAEAEVLTQALLQFQQALSDSITLELAQWRLRRLEDQLNRQSARLAVGQALSTDSLTLAAQLLREKAQYLALYNRHRENKLLLLQLMGAEATPVDSVEFTLGLPPVDLGPLSEAEAITLALQQAPEIEEARWRLLQQTYARKAVRAEFFPTLNLSASLQTNYSSNAGLFRITPTGVVREPLSFERQLRENFNQSIFVSLSIPIFQQFRRRLRLARAESGVETAEIQLRLQTQQVVRRTQQAYLVWRNAVVQEAALQISSQTAEKALAQAEAQYQAGLISYWSYREALSTAAQARLELEQARLERQIRTLLLGAYLGKYREL
ncbi:MAG: TolC family protein [Bacteroidia bacterium]